MTKRIINTDNAPAAVGAYSQCVFCNVIYYFSGMLGLDPKTMNLAETFEGQLDQIMTNIDALLNAEGLSRNDIIKTTVFMTDLANFAKVNAAYDKFFQKPYPARSAVQVSALPKAAQIEIEVIAQGK